MDAGATVIPTAHQALAWVARLAAFALVLQSAELIALRDQWTEQGAWRWRTLRADFATWPAFVRGLLDAMLGTRGFLFVVLARMSLCAVGAVLVDAPFVWPIVMLLNVLVLLRFRGSFNGGSDTMTLVVTSALALYSLGPHDTFTAVVALGYIAFQCVISYLMAGWVKLRTSHWRRGDALSHFILESSYDVPMRIKALASAHPLWMRLLAWAVLAFELSFACALLGPRAAWTWLACGLAFHMGAFVVFGLNRFVFAWLATYPAVLFFAYRLWS